MDNTTPPPIPPNPPPVIAPVRAVPPRRRSGAWPAIALVLLCLLLVSAYSNIKHMFGGGMGSRSSLPSRAGIPRLEENVIEDNESTNKFAVIEVDGIITSGFERGGSTMVEMIQDQFKVAARDRRVKAV